MERIGLDPGSVALVLLLLLLVALFFFSWWIKRGRAGTLRPLPGLEALSDAVGRSAETGQPLHVSVGIAGIGDLATAETWAGLTLLAQLADKAASFDTPLIVTVADPTALPIAQDILRRAYARHGNPEGYDPTQVRFIAPVPMAYAAGVAGLLEREPLTSNVMAGSFGDEYLLIGETGARRAVQQVVGTAEPRALPLMLATADHTLIGEEIFAAGPYVRRLPVQVGSLLAQDLARWIVVAAIIAGAVWQALTAG